MSDDDQQVFQFFDGKAYFVVDGPSLDPIKQVSRYALAVHDLGIYINRYQLTAVAQFYKLIFPGLILTRHIFHGFNRCLYCDDTREGDLNKYAFSWKPAYDYWWKGDSSGIPVRELAPPNSVFVVLISKNEKHKDKFPSIDGWIDRWCWVAEDSALPEAPLSWIDRYNKKVFTRN